MKKSQAAMEFLMTYGWAILVVLVAIGVLAYFGVFNLHTNLEANQGCTSSGGSITLQSCCQSVSDFPNTCAVGACGCSEADSKQVSVCVCPEGYCFDGNECVQP
jgi:hypothetical protein